MLYSEKFNKNEKEHSRLLHKVDFTDIDVEKIENAGCYVATFKLY